MANDQLREVWIKMQIWYRESNGQQDSPNREGLEYTSTLREDLYRWLPLEGEPIAIMVQPVSIADGPPDG